MSKDELILLLKKYKENKSKLKLRLREKEYILREIENMKDISIGASSTEINSNIHSKNVISDKVANNAIYNTDTSIELEQKLIKIEKQIRELECKIEDIDIRLESLKKKEREILIDYYVEGNTYEQIGNVTYYKLFGQTRSEKAIQKIVERATKKMISL